MINPSLQFVTSEDTQEVSCWGAICYLPHFPEEAHFLSFFASPHFPEAWHFFAPSHLAADWHFPDLHFETSASFPDVHPVKATIASPKRAVSINFFILSPI